MSKELNQSSSLLNILDESCEYFIPLLTQGMATLIVKLL
jgi:hypothetical protein